LTPGNQRSILFHSHQVQVYTMAKAEAVAAYLVYLAQVGEEGEPDPLTHLRLQKLLYYVQGWSVALRGQPMFADAIEAWVYGPVVVPVYHQMKKFGARAFVIPDETNPPDFDATLTAADQEFIRGVWDEYKVYSALKLRDMTHHEEPWQNARKGYGPTERSSAPITPDAMKAYFGAERRTLAERRGRVGYPVIDPIAGWAAAEDAGRPGHRSEPAADVFTRLLAQCPE